MSFSLLRSSTLKRRKTCPHIWWNESWEIGTNDTNSYHTIGTLTFSSYEIVWFPLLSESTSIWISFSSPCGLCPLLRNSETTDVITRASEIIWPWTIFSDSSWLEHVWIWRICCITVFWIRIRNLWSCMSYFKSPLIDLLHSWEREYRDIKILCPWWFIECPSLCINIGDYILSPICINFICSWFCINRSTVNSSPPSFS